MCATWGQENKVSVVKKMDEFFQAYDTDIRAKPFIKCSGSRDVWGGGCRETSRWMGKLNMKKETFDQYTSIFNKQYFMSQ